MKKYLIVVVLLIVIAASGIFYFLRQKADAPAATTTNTPSTNNSLRPSNTSTSSAIFDKSKYSVTEPTSLWVVVNKKNSIPTNFTPEIIVPNVRLRLSEGEEQMHINTQTAPAIKEMFDAAQKEGVRLIFGSGYRSAAKQKQFYDSYVAKDGKQAADTYSARPGHSEHQTGFAADITSPSGKCHLQICWEDTPEGKWLAASSWKYGFIIRYPNGKTNITGYQYEPWHVRYVGKELAAQIHQTGQTLEEFFKLPPAPNYD